MKYFTMLLALNLIVALPAPVEADVEPSTMHSNDALLVNDLIGELGYSDQDYTVAILRAEGYGVSYFVKWYDDWWTGTQADYEKLGASVGSVGGVSATTSWKSSYLCVGFEDKLFVLSTSDARWFVENVETMSDNDVSRFIRNRIEMLDI